jgi:hypothetical protein
MSNMDHMRYEDVPLNLRASMDQGHVLARHTVTDEDNVAGYHLTTVQLSYTYDDDGRSLHFCNDVCSAVCEPGSVQVLMVSYPAKPIAATEAPEQESVALEALKDLSFLMGKVDAVRLALAEINPRLEEAFAAENRLAALRDATFSLYFVATKSGNTIRARQLATTLFFIAAGLKPGEDPEMFERFVTHLADAVAMGAESMPVFLPEIDEENCGD